MYVSHIKQLSPVVRISDYSPMHKQLLGPVIFVECLQRSPPVLLVLLNGSMIYTLPTSITQAIQKIPSMILSHTP